MFDFDVIMILFGPRHWAVINRAEFYVLTYKAYLPTQARADRVLLYYTLPISVLLISQIQLLFRKGITVKMLANLFAIL